MPMFTPALHTLQTGDAPAVARTANARAQSSAAMVAGNHRLNAILPAAIRSLSEQLARMLRESHPFTYEDALEAKVEGRTLWEDLWVQESAILLQVLLDD